MFFLQNIFYFYSNLAGVQLLWITDHSVYNAITASSHRKHKAITASRENNGNQNKFSWVSDGFALTCHCCYRHLRKKESCFQVDVSHFSSSALINFRSTSPKALDLLSLLLSFWTLTEATAWEMNCVWRTRAWLPRKYKHFCHDDKLRRRVFVSHLTGCIVTRTGSYNPE